MSICLEPSTTAAVRSSAFLRLLRFRYVVVAVPLALLTMVAFRSWGDWYWQAVGAQLLHGDHRLASDVLVDHPGGLRLYAEYPMIQVGPIALIAASLLLPFGPYAGQILASAVIVAIGLAVLGLAERLAVRRDPSRSIPVSTNVIIVGLLLTPSWAQMAGRYTHLDDALALLLCVAALAALERGAPATVGLLVGLAVDAKPWAIGFVALALAFTGAQRWRSIAVAAATIAIAWLPFIVADPSTLHALQPQGGLSAGAPLRLLGFGQGDDLRPVRIAQLCLVGLLGALLVKKGQWYLVPVGAVAGRLLLDPFTLTYYAGGLALAAALADISRPGKPPYFSILATGYLVSYSNWLSDPHARSWLRLVSCLAALAVCLIARSEGGRARAVVA